MDGNRQCCALNEWLEFKIDGNGWQRIYDEWEWVLVWNSGMIMGVSGWECIHTGWTFAIISFESIVACTCNPATLKDKFQNGVVQYQL